MKDCGRCSLFYFSVLERESPLRLEVELKEEMQSPSDCFHFLKICDRSVWLITNLTYNHTTLTQIGSIITPWTIFSKEEGN